MPQTHEHDHYAQLLHRFDLHATLLSVVPLTGGVSATVVALEVVWGDGRADKLVARQHGEIDRARNPRVARDEFRLLQIAHGQGIPVPTPYFVDETCELVPLPVVVVAFVDGATEFAPSDLEAYLNQAAMALAKIHRLPSAEASFLPEHHLEFEPAPNQPDEVMGETRIRDALAFAHPMEQANETVVLHGDYWPGNLLWRDDELVAIIDWEDACLGDPLVDLGNTRLEMLWAFGEEAVEAFTERYCAECPIDLTNLPYWDLRAALKACSKVTTWGLEVEMERRMIERHAAFVAQAITASRLGG